ncbi:dynein cytoplasmic light chain, partial [Mytilus galloprovincialis]
MFIAKGVKMSERKAVIKNADMSEDMQQDAVDCATQALEKYNIEKDIAAYIKKEFDKKYNPTWHCITGHTLISNKFKQYNALKKLQRIEKNGTHIIYREKYNEEQMIRC